MMTDERKLISIVIPTFNEEENIVELVRRLNAVRDLCDRYRFEFIFIDNASRDNSVRLIKEVCQTDRDFKLILNRRNYGHIRSPVYGMLQSSGDAVIFMAADLQDPPELILDFIVGFEEGFEVVLAVKPQSKTNFFIHNLRKLFYYLLDQASVTPQVRNATGYGLYSRDFIEMMRSLNDPYPYFRGLVGEFGCSVKTVTFVQPNRFGGVTKNNLATLYDIGMLAFVSHGMAPIRLVSFFGVVLGAITSNVGILYLIMKLLYWDSFPLGTAPVLIGLFFVGSFILIAIGVLGEYIASLHRFAANKPLVIERERVNFD